MFSEHAPEIKLTSDLLTFVGALILASEAWSRLAHLRTLFGMLKLFEIRDTAQLEIDSQVVQSEEDLQKIFAGRVALRAFVGAFLLLLGFIGTVIVDVSELKAFR